MTSRSQRVGSRNLWECRRGARETDPLEASIWAVNAAIQSGHDDAVDDIVRESEEVLASWCSPSTHEHRSPR